MTFFRTEDELIHLAENGPAQMKIDDARRLFPELTFDDSDLEYRAVGVVPREDVRALLDLDSTPILPALSKDKCVIGRSTIINKIQLLTV